MAKDELITKAGKVEISSRWWKSAWPAEVKKNASHKQMTDAIAEFEKQKRNRSKTKILITLGNISVFADVLKKDAQKTFSSYPKFRSSFQKNIEKIENLAMAQKKLVADTGNKSTKIWEKDLSQSVKTNLEKSNRALADRIDFDKLKRIVKIKIPEIVLTELEERNADTQIYRELDKIHTSFGQKCASQINTKLSNASHLTKENVATINKSIGTWTTHFEKAVSLVPEQVIAKIAIHKSIASQYKRERAIAITRAGVGVAVSGVAIAAPGTQALAIAGLIRSCVSLGKEISSFAANIERKMINLRGYIKLLDVAYNKAGLRHDSELTLSLLNGVLGVDVLPTLKKAQDDLADVSKNFSLIYTRLQKKQTVISNAIKKVEKLKSDISDSAIQKSKVKTIKMHQDIVFIEGMLNAQLEEAFNSARRINRVEKEMPNLKKKLDDLDKNSTALKVCAGLSRAAGGLAWSITGTFDAASIIDETDKSVAVLMNSMSILSDISGEMEDLI